MLLSNLETVNVNGDICYFLADVSKAIKYKSYVPQKLLKGIPKEEVREAYRPDLYKKTVQRKFICVTEKGAKQIIARRKSNNINKSKFKLMSLNERINLARKYHVSEGFITAHMYAGDLEKQLKYRSEAFGVDDIAKTFTCKDFTKKTLW